MTELEIKNALSAFGDVVSVKRILKNEVFIGTAFVEFADTDTAERVKQRDDDWGITIHNRQVRVEYALPDTTLQSKAASRREKTAPTRPEGCVTVHLSTNHLSNYLTLKVTCPSTAPMNKYALPCKTVVR